MTRINEELQRWLDGEIDEEALSAEAREDARFWRHLLDVAGRDPGPPPPWLVQSVMRSLPERRPSPWSRVVEWLRQPQTVRIRPATVGALALAALVTFLVWPSTAPVTPPESAARAAGASTDDGRVYVQFVYVAPEAASVAVAGDFNEWSPELSLRDPDGDGVWSGYMPLSPGLHQYMFVVDGQWVTDPRADRYIDDGFGNRNALISVNPPGSQT